MRLDPVLAQPNPPCNVLAARYESIRRFSEQLAAPLSPEDCSLQSMPDASPTKWHLAHTTWFFETFLLGNIQSYQPFNDDYAYLFNSYYNTVGRQFPRPQRGMLSRPSLADVLAYRQYVDERMTVVLSSHDDLPASQLDVVELGLHHEQQHQELLLTDIKHLLSLNPLHPQYQDYTFAQSAPVEQRWCDLKGGIHLVGHDGIGFCFDNETPRHEVLLRDFSLANQPVTCGEFLQFIDDRGYERPELWLSLGWQTVCERKWIAPLYWQRVSDHWHEFTLSGLREINPLSPVCHVSYFEADAYARWAGARLPTEGEWEVASNGAALAGNFVEGLFGRKLAIHPTTAASSLDGPTGMFGDVWEWTASPYAAYPGYAPPQGALGEYNGKFMCNQFVLRGGSCATSTAHMRKTYRNFFPPDSRWQFAGIRLAQKQ